MDELSFICALILWISQVVRRGIYSIILAMFYYLMKNAINNIQNEQIPLEKFCK